MVSNDLINGNLPHWETGNATIAQSGSWPSGITLNTTTGAVSVAPGTPAGNYQVPYVISHSSQLVSSFGQFLSYLQYYLRRTKLNLDSKSGDCYRKIVNYQIGGHYR